MNVRRFCDNRVTVHEVEYEWQKEIEWLVLRAHGRKYHSISL